MFEAGKASNCEVAQSKTKTKKSLAQNFLN